jgi:3-oxoacyl-[acyl-carrier-protein] synthase III
MISLNTVITGTGSFIPTQIKNNEAFIAQQFFTENNQFIDTDPNVIVQKFEQITGIKNRRYAPQGINASEMAFAAATLAIEDAGCDIETIDQIILAHNFGNVLNNTIQSDAVPALASRVKHLLKIKNPNCVAYDILFGCPGWLQGVIQAHAFFKADVAKKCLVIGTETLSRVIDPFDRDSMIFADGAGACVVEALPTQSGSGILGCSVQSHCVDEIDFINMGKSYLPNADDAIRFIKMKGRKVYEYAIKYVPLAMKDCLEKSNVDIVDVKKVFIHQANEKMDEGMIKALYKLYNINTVPANIMPMSIHELGNSSVATIPTLFDRVKKGLMPDHQLHTDDIILFASVGAGMNINAICYRM